MSARRPWRAAAYAPNGYGGRAYVGRVAGRTWRGIAPWVRRHRAAGWHVVVWEVMPIRGTTPEAGAWEQRRRPDL